MTYDDEECESVRDRIVREAIEAADARRLAEAAKTPAREWRPAEEPMPHPRAAAKQRRSKMDERGKHQLASYIRSAVERQVTAALQRERVAVADAVGKAIAQERKTFRALAARIETVEQRAASLERREFFESLAERISAIEQRGAADDNNSAATVLDLSDERRRRAGE